MPIPNLPPPYPLSWPDGWARTPSNRRKNAPYKVTFDKALQALLEELRLFKITKAVLTSNLTVRLDGLPYAEQRTTVDPGIAVWWFDERVHEMRVLPCDRWASARENLRAIGLAVAAMRQIERCGASQILERAQQAFNVKALPASTIAPREARPWWFYRLHLKSWPPTADAIRQAHREAAKKDHPDGGGDVVDFVELTQAYADGIRWANEGGNA